MLNLVQLVFAFELMLAGREAMAGNIDRSALLVDLELLLVDEKIGVLVTM